MSGASRGGLSLQSSVVDDGSSTTAEMLYLISLYLEKHTPCTALSKRLVEELESSSCFGTIFTWDGATRPASVGDIRVKHADVQSDQLLQHLLRHVVQERNHNPFKSGSLLLLENKELEKNNPDELMKYAMQIIEFSSKNVEGKMDIDEEKYVSENSDHIIDDCVQRLSRCNFNSTFQLGSHVQCSLHFMDARLSGLSGLSAFLPSSLMRTDHGSFSKQKMLMTCRYNFSWRVSGHLNNPAYNVLFDRTGRYVITGADDALVKIWDVEQGLLLRTLRGHQGCIAHIAVSHDNSMLASCCINGTIRVWRLSDGYCLCIMKSPYNGCINLLSFDHASTALISVGDDGCCVVWDMFSLITESNADNCGDSAVLNLVRNCMNWTGCEIGINESSMRVCTNEIHKSHVASGSEGSAANVVGGGVGRFSEEKPVESIPGSTIFENYTESDKFRIVATNLLPQKALPWTKNSNLSNLLLRHFKDSSQDIRRVVALDICPFDRVIVTGCDDGLAQIWRFGEKLHSDERLLIGDTKPFFENIDDIMSEAFLQQSHRRADESYVRSGLHVLCRLEGHVSAVMDVKFSRAGDRVVTGSMKDGTVRVWSFAKDFAATDHIIIPLNDGEEEMDMLPASRFAPFRGRLGRAARMGAKSEVYNVCWSCDDTYIMVLQSLTRNEMKGASTHDNTQIPTRLKQFDSMTGELLNVLNVSDFRVDTLIGHPLYPWIAVTGGADGIVTVWNIKTSAVICEHLINIEAPLTLEEINSAAVHEPNINLLPADIIEICFTADGAKFAVTDSFGRLSMFGLGDVSSRYEGKYCEQYFSTDYHEVAYVTDMDPRGFDAGTLVPLNECAPGPLCRQDGSAYEDQPSSNIFFVGEKADDTIHRIKEIIDGSKTFDKNLERSYIAYRRLNKQKQLGEVPQTQSTMTRGWKSNVHTIKSPSSRGAANVAQNRIRGIFDESGGGGRDFIQSNMYRTGAQRQSADGAGSSRRTAFQVGSDPSDDSSEEEYFPQTQSRAQRTSLRSSKRHTGRARQQSYADISMSEDSDPGSYSGESSVAYDKNSVEESEGEQYEAPSSQRLVRSSQRSKSGHQSSSKSRRGRLPRSIQSPGRSKKKSSKITKAKPVKGGNSLLQPWTVLGGHRTVPVGEFIDRAWLQQDEPNDLQYSPQCGDHVVYFPQGHIEHLHDFPEASAPPWISFSSKWPMVECKIINISFEFPTHREHKSCKSVIARLRLQVLGVPLNWTPSGSSTGCVAGIYKTFGQLRATRHSSSKSETEFDVNLRCCSAPDFIVPIYMYNRAASIRWQPGLRFQTYFKEDSSAFDSPGSSSSGLAGIASPQTTRNFARHSGGPFIGSLSSKMSVYTGKITSISDSNHDEWPRSPWESLVVLWTMRNNDTVLWDEIQDETNAPLDRISPWDAYILEGRVGISSEAVSSSSRHDSATPPGEHIPASICREVLQKIDELLEGERASDFQPFSLPVDPTSFEDYYSIVPVPIDLGLIKRRIQNNYYRQIEALEFDTSLIFSNCILYNHEDAPIVEQARDLMNILLWAIRPETISGNTAMSSGVVASDNTQEAQLNPRSTTSIVLKLRGIKAVEESALELLDSAEIAAVDDETSVNMKDSDTEANDGEHTLRIKLKGGIISSTSPDGEIDVDEASSAEELPPQKHRDTRGATKVRYQGESDDEKSSEASISSESSNEERVSKRRRIKTRSSNWSTRKRPRMETSNTRSLRLRRPSENQNADSEESEASEYQSSVAAEPTRQTRGSVRTGHQSSKNGSARRMSEEGKLAASATVEQPIRIDSDIYSEYLWPSFNAVEDSDLHSFFAEPVTDDIAPGYSKIITRPTDLSSLRQKLNSRKFRTLAQYKEEMLRMFSNCEKFNEPGSLVSTESARLRKVFLDQLSESGAVAN